MAARSPERIDEVLATIRSYWYKNPDLRLTQIIKVAHHRSGYEGQTVFIEDDLLLAGLRMLDGD